MPVQVRRRWTRPAIALVAVYMILALAPMAAKAQEKEPPTKQSKGLMQRIDFSTSHILGQSIKSGAVYLMHRKKSDIKNMLEVRENYRAEIMEDYGLEKTAIASGDAAQARDQRK
jgi:hypothetical protein